MLGYVLIWDLGLCLVLFGLLGVLFLYCLPASLDEREYRHGGPSGVQAAPYMMYMTFVAVRVPQDAGRTGSVIDG